MLTSPEIHLSDPDILTNYAQEHDAIPKLYDGLVGLFNFRQSLFTETPQSVVEIDLTEHSIRELSLFLAKQDAIGDVADTLFLRGAIDTREEVTRFTDCIYNGKDGEVTRPTVLVPMIGIVGRIGSGKGTVGEIVRETHNSVHFPLSDRLREFAVAEGKFPPHTRETLREINDQLKPRFGKHVFVEWTRNMGQRLAKQRVVPIITIDGFRSTEESIWFKQRGGYFMKIETSKENRFQRLKERSRSSDDLSWEKFVQSDAIESEWIDPIFKLCAVTVQNDGTIEELREQIQIALKTLHISGISSL